MLGLSNAKAKQYEGKAMLRLRNAKASVIQGLIAPKGLDCLKALISWEFENKLEGGGGEKKTIVLSVPLVAFLLKNLVPCFYLKIFESMTLLISINFIHHFNT